MNISKADMEGKIDSSLTIQIKKESWLVLFWRRKNGPGGTCTRCM